MQRIPSDRITFWLLAALLLVFVEVMFFHNGSVLFFLFGIGLIYVSVRRKSRFFFWSGIVFLGISLISMWSLRLLIVVTIVYILFRLWKGDETQQVIEPFLPDEIETPNTIIQNKLFSTQSTPFQAYEWQDIHVQGFYGNINIDATQTVLPKGTSLISVRQGIGKIQIAVPYEIPVRIHYTTFFGDAKLFSPSKKRLWNQSIVLQNGYTEAHGSASSELIIAVSTWLGDVEVIRK
ncbi:cell wall-active antibiotics response protein LiaF [Paenisporosarcina sp. TG20]|uniref:cell wall-active antibiotics response protein LiaF n=1 Tax=Paenisporosarcina sp. TG20 TaxID=1211706 RepID=UPI0002F13C4E|nr:cell wall-active antibiotics response protein LiaF [Paenisporosarcina sp. TG20]